jgi:hypothetical protein
VEELIKNAIEQQQLIRFYYDGGVRVVEPFCYGLSKARHKVLRGYQVGGYSKSGVPVGWRLYKISEMNNIALADERFEIIRPGYNPNDSGMIQIFSRV